MIRLASAAALVIALLLPAFAQAEPCTYVDLQGKFQITVDCAALQDYSGIANEQKRIWLANEEVHLNIIEVPDPYRTAPLEVVMEKHGRFWTARRTPKGLQDATVGGVPAKVILERVHGTTSRTYVFQIGGRNVLARIAAHGKRRHREELLDTYCGLFLDGFELAPEGTRIPRPEAAYEKAPRVAASSGAATAAASTGTADEDARVNVKAKLSGDSLKRFKGSRVASRLQSKLGVWLDSTAPDGGVKLEVVVQDYRLRTDGEVAMTGMMSGPDELAATVTLLRDGGDPTSIKVETKLVSGGFRIKESKRLSDLLTKFMDELKAEL